MAAESDACCAGQESRAKGQPLVFRCATPDDAPLLARLNRELIEDERHGNPMSVPELEERLRGWLAGEYCATLVASAERVVAYALYRLSTSGVYVRHLYVVRDARRQGIATETLRYLARHVSPTGARITLDVLVGNADAIAFYQALGFQPYAMTLTIDAEALA